MTDAEVNDEWVALVVRAKFTGYYPRKLNEWLDERKWPVTRRRACLAKLLAIVVNEETTLRNTNLLREYRDGKDS